MEKARQDQLRRIPGVDKILERARTDPFFDNVPKTVLTRAARRVTEDLRRKIQSDEGVADAFSHSGEAVMRALRKVVGRDMTPNLKRVVNATGVVVHTNLGRSLLSSHALANMETIAGKYSNLEFDLDGGRRGSRYSAVADLLCEITGAEAAMVVNNNAGAVFLSLESLANGGKVIVSRGELVEIGGSFRIPDVMAKSGAVLKEVGTTNRTHLRDYEGAIESDTRLLLKVHTSNYSIVGFHKEVPLKELVFLGNKFHIPVMEDLGSGTFVDFSQYGLAKEPTVQESVRAGADVVTFSGDKLLGGPQAGIILGKAEHIDKIRQNPINRALRIDKLTLAALESTLRHYRDPATAISLVPTLRMLTQPFRQIEEKAEQLETRLTALKEDRLNVRVLDLASRAGGGSLPLLALPSKGVGITVGGMSVNAIEKNMRTSSPPVIGRIEDDAFVMDVRTIDEDDIEDIVRAVQNTINTGPLS